MKVGTYVVMLDHCKLLESLGGRIGCLVKAVGFRLPMDQELHRNGPVQDVQSGSSLC